MRSFGIALLKEFLSAPQYFVDLVCRIPSPTSTGINWSEVKLWDERVVTHNELLTVIDNLHGYSGFQRNATAQRLRIAFPDDNRHMFPRGKFRRGTQVYLNIKGDLTSMKRLSGWLQEDGAMEGYIVPTGRVRDEISREDLKSSAFVESEDWHQEVLPEVETRRLTELISGLDKGLPPMIYSYSQHGASAENTIRCLESVFLRYLGFYEVVSRDSVQELSWASPALLEGDSRVVEFKRRIERRFWMSVHVLWLISKEGGSIGSVKPDMDAFEAFSSQLAANPTHKTQVWSNITRAKLNDNDLHDNSSKHRYSPRAYLDFFEETMGLTFHRVGLPYDENSDYFVRKCKSANNRKQAA